MKTIIMLFLFVSLNAFAEETAKPAPAVQNANSETPLKSEPPSEKTEAVAPTISNQDGYFYDPTGRRDPFKPFFTTVEPLPVASSEVDTKKVEVVNENILLNYDLDKYKVVAILWQVKDPKVVIKDPAGKTHLMRKENKLGKNNGFIAEIREGEVVVVEPVTAESGVSSATTKILTLRK